MTRWQSGEWVEKAQRERDTERGREKFLRAAWYWPLFLRCIIILKLFTPWTLIGIANADSQRLTIRIKNANRAKEKKMGTLFKSYCASSFSSPHVKVYGDWKKNKECSFYIYSTYTVCFFVTRPRSHAAVCADMKNNILKQHPSNIFFPRGKDSLLTWLGSTRLWCPRNSWEKNREKNFNMPRRTKYGEAKLRRAAAVRQKSPRCTNNTRAASLLSAGRWQNLKAKAE